MASKAIVSEIQNVKDTKTLKMSEQKTMQHKDSLQSEFYDSLEKLEKKAICEYEENIQSNFIIRQKSKYFGTEDFQQDIIKNVIEVSHGVGIKFTGVPYMSVGRKICVL